MNPMQTIRAYIDDDLTEKWSELLAVLCNKYPEDNLFKAIRRIHQFTEDMVHLDYHSYDDWLVNYAAENDDAVENLWNAIAPLVHGYLVLSISGTTYELPADDVSFLDLQHTAEVNIILATKKLAHAVCVSCLDRLTKNFDGTYTYRISAIYDMDYEQYGEVHSFGDFK